MLTITYTLLIYDARKKKQAGKNLFIALNKTRFRERIQDSTKGPPPRLSLLDTPTHSVHDPCHGRLH